MPFRIDPIGVADGLTQGSVYYMLKDSRGFMWFGTQDGLNRYDGHRFQTYRPVLDSRGLPQPGSIHGINIFGIIEDPDGNLWIGTEEGLNRYDRLTDQFEFMHQNKSGTRHTEGRILPFSADETDLLYLSDADGLVRFAYRTGKRTVLAADLRPPKEYDLQSSTVRTPAGDVWLHAPKGLMRYNLNDHSVSYYFSDRPDNVTGTVQAVFSFFVDADNLVWIGTADGLIRFDYRTKTHQTYSMADTGAVGAIYSIAPDQRGRLWLGTQRNGVVYFDKRARLFGHVRQPISSNRPLTDFEISKIFVDDMGIVWANADPGGLVRIVPDAFVFGGFHKQQTASLLPDRMLSNYTVRGFMEERFDRIWIATATGIDVLNPQTNRIVQRFLTNATRGDVPKQTVVKCLYRDPQRRIWVGMPGGVLAYQPNSQTFVPIRFNSDNSLLVSNYVRNLTSLSDTMLVAATEAGLYLLNTRQERWTKLPHLSGTNIFSLWYDAPTRQLWVGTFLNGYFCYQLPDTLHQNEKLRPWKLLKSGLGGSTVLHIRPDGTRKTRWLSTDRGLVALKPQSGQITVYAEAQGLANSFVYGSLPDVTGGIWLSTNRGLSRLDPATGSIKNFTPADGLQGYEYNGNAFLKAANGELYFGGVDGFNRFWPNQFRSSFFNPSVYIYSLLVNEKRLDANDYVGEMDRIDLRHDQNTLSLEFAALDYLSNGHNTYQYKLAGYDDNWVMAGERNYVRYANLPPGAYTFLVKATNRDGKWSDRTRQMIIQINPPFWRTWSFIMLLALLLTTLVLAWVRRREDAIRKQQADRLRLAYDIQEQVKRGIARDLHDEIGTRLATVKLYTTQLTRLAGETPAILSLKTTIFSLINDTISDVRNLLRKLNPKTLEQYGYVAAIEELFDRVNASGVVRAQVLLEQKTPGEPTSDTCRLPADVEVMLYRITQELVSNSLKHANPRRINLRVLMRPDAVRLRYADDGNGFDREQTQQSSTGLGMGSIESRVALLNGKITWQTQPGQGVYVTIDVSVSGTPGRAYSWTSRLAKRNS